MAGTWSAHTGSRQHGRFIATLDNSKSIGWELSSGNRGVSIQYISPKSTIHEWNRKHNMASINVHDEILAYRDKTGHWISCEHKGSSFLKKGIKGQKTVKVCVIPPGSTEKNVAFEDPPEEAEKTLDEKMKNDAFAGAAFGRGQPPQRRAFGSGGFPMPGGGFNGGFGAPPPQAGFGRGRQSQIGFGRGFPPDEIGFGRGYPPDDIGFGRGRQSQSGFGRGQPPEEIGFGRGRRAAPAMSILGPARELELLKTQLREEVKMRKTAEEKLKAGGSGGDDGAALELLKKDLALETKKRKEAEAKLLQSGPNNEDLEKKLLQTLRKIESQEKELVKVKSELTASKEEATAAKAAAAETGGNTASSEEVDKLKAQIEALEQQHKMALEENARLEEVEIEMERKIKTEQEKTKAVKDEVKEQIKIAQEKDEELKELRSKVIEHDPLSMPHIVKGHWVTVQTPDLNHYYWNILTDQTLLINPYNPWLAKEHEGKIFWFNTLSLEASWEKPEQTDEEPPLLENPTLSMQWV